MKPLIIVFALFLAACESPNQPVNTTYMTGEIHVDGRSFEIDFSDFTDLSIPVDTAGPLAWYLSHADIEPVRDKNWVGAVAEGGSVNFRNIAFNPHGHGTHTEGPGHVQATVHSIDRAVKSYHSLARVVTVDPAVLPDGDRVIYWVQLEEALADSGVSAVIIRTGADDRRNVNWSNTNPPYLDAGATAEMASMGIDHLLIDLPSVDREVDGGKLAAHKAFWNIPGEVRMEATITELIYVPESVKDGTYLLNLQIGPFVNDAAPSRPVIYPLREKKS